MSIRINGVDRESQTHEYSSTNHGMYHMQANPNLYEPQRSTDFEFVVTDLDGLTNISTGNSFENAQEVLRLSVITSPVPHFTINVLRQRRGNSVQTFAGTPEFQDGTIEVYDWIGSDSKSILEAWQHQAYDVNTDKVGLLADYKKQAYLIEYTPDKQKVRQWVLYGCWVSSISEQPYDHSEMQSDRRITATITFDKAIPDQTDLN